MFIGRKDELELLKEKYSSSNFEMIALLGRRRIGKSMLIHESQKDFDGIVISFQCSDTGYRANLDYLEMMIKETFKQKYLSFSSLTDIILFLYEEAKKQKILFVLDEYPYMRNDRETDSEIKNAVDEINKLDTNNPFKFIVCGSAVEIMNCLDDENMPLRGRFTSIIRLDELNYLESSLFYEKASNEDKVKYYAVFGGIPYYLKQINPRLSFDENMINLFFNDNALLANELESLVNGAINKIEKASYLLNIIKNKTISYSDINSTFKSMFPNKQIDYSLNKLLKLNIVKKVIVENSNNKKKEYYKISNNSLSFYYTFLITPFANRLLFTSKEYYELFIKEKLNRYFIPIGFEDVAYQFIILMSKHHLLKDSLVDLFSYIVNDKATHKSYQFDVVGKSVDGLINYECKFVDGDLSINEIEEEKEQARAANTHFFKTVFITKNPLDIDDEHYSLDDVYSTKLLN